MADPFYAHSKDYEPRELWQSLEDHLNQVAKLARSFADEFGAGEWAYLAGLWHDVGKYSPAFQQMIGAANGLNPSGAGRVNHSSAGALLAVEKFVLAGRIFAYLISGHHAGLPDWEGDESGNAALSLRLKSNEFLESARNSIPQVILGQTFPKERPEKGTDPALWIRMLFSCMVDSDFLDTEAFIESKKAALRGRYPKMSGLLPRLTIYMKEKETAAEDTPVNRIRSEILARCIEVAKQPPGIYTLTVPTGGGKTLSSMAFALHHAAIYGKHRIIYVIPYTSIIEQTADEFRKIFGEAVVEHHSNFDSSEESEENTRLRLACENWDAPVVVTTSVQFFESLFASRTSRCRKLHNIINSVVVLDEVQLIPPEFLKPILHALDQLRKSYGVTLLLATATQPAFCPQPSFGFDGLSDTVEIVHNQNDLYQRLKRVDVVIPQNLHEPKDWQEIATELQEFDSVLCIVNRRDDCRKLWEMMPEGTYHLSALMCGAHRSQKIAKIKERLKAGIATRVISTQLVEAGVDVDFPVVYRAVAGLDSIAQAAGRCNREGRKERGKVIVFCPPTEPPVGHLRQAAQIGRRLLETECEDALAPDRFKQFFEELYWLQGERLDAKDILSDLAPDGDFRFSFRTASQKFKLIDETQQAQVIVAYEDGASLINLLEKKGPERWLLRKLQRFVVNIPRYLHKRLLSEGSIRELSPGIFVQGHTALYHEELGFCSERSAIYDPDDLIC